VAVDIPGVFKRVVSPICVHKTHSKLSCGTSAVGPYVSHALLSVGELDTGDRTICRSFMKICRGVLYKLVVAQESRERRFIN
jgi:hypothetical protein